MAERKFRGRKTAVRANGWRAFCPSRTGGQKSRGREIDNESF